MNNNFNKKNNNTSLHSLASKAELTEKIIANMVDYLKDAIDYENNYNIGLTGSYGSGKSSIIKTYEKQSEKKLLYISLAILNESDSNNDQKSLTLEERLEKAIVNQIVHQIDPSDIPQSRLKPKKTKNYFLRTIFISIGILLLLLNIPQSYNYIEKLFSFNLDELKPCLFACIIIYSMTLIYYIIKNFNFSSIIKFKSELYEIEANTNENINDNNSYFDKHLDDILYCISQSKCDAIVFEDIDRFNNQEIFIKLKEINNLLNNRHIFGGYKICKKIKNKFFKQKKIPFIYAMNDDLFKSNDKTKFFDIVIPVVPYINGSNSAETFDKLFRSNINIKPESVVLSILSYYITDMRLLKNIYNEYIIYIDSLSNESFKQHDYNQLFSLIVYKNLYPTDFSQLQFMKGSLYRIINARNRITQQQKQSFVEQINKIEEEIKTIEKEFIQNEYELNILYSHGRDRYRTYYPEKPLIETFNGISDIAIEKNNNEYKKRLTLIENKNNNYINVLKGKIDELNKKIEALNVEKFSHLIQRIEDVNKFIENQEIDKNHIQFIRTLIVNDFINEDYWRYLSYFHEGNASDIDKDFIKSVYAKEKPKYDIELNDVEWIISKIQHGALDNNFALLNCSLLYYLSKNYNEIKDIERLYIQILGLIEQYEDKYLFIIAYYKYCFDKDVVKNKDLLNDLYKNNPQLVSDIFLYKTPIMPNNYDIVYYSMIRNSDIIKIDNIFYNIDKKIKDDISEYVSTSSSILKRDYVIKDVYWTYLKNFNVKFQNLTYIDEKIFEEGKLERFLSYIFQADLYEVNEENINYIVNNYFKLKANELVQDKSNYEIYLYNLYGKTAVLNEFIKVLNLNTDDNIKFEYSEDIENIMIKNQNVNTDYIIEFLDKYRIIINDINKAREDLWYHLVQYSLVNPTWKNIITFYEKFKNNKEEINDVIMVIKEFVLENKMQDKLDTNLNEDLFNIIIVDEIEKEKFLNIIKTFEQNNKIPTDIAIDDNNMIQLLRNNIFAPTKENFDICYNKYRNQFHYFILNNIQLYIENIGSYVISKDQLEYIANINKIDTISLFRIISYYFINNSYTAYRDIKINNISLVDKIFKSDISKDIKAVVFKRNIDFIIKENTLFFSCLSYVIDNNLYGKIKNLFDHKRNYIQLLRDNFIDQYSILSLLVEQNILEKKEHSKYIELYLSNNLHNIGFFQK